MRPARFAFPITFALLLLSAFGTKAGANTTVASGPESGALPAGTKISFHLTRALGSGSSKTGEPFQFVLIDPIVVNAATTLKSGTIGYGTVYLSGHAGTSGHEGDLTLRIDSLPTEDGRELAFSDQRLSINGRNRKIMSGVLGFIPYVGIGAMFIRGADIRIDPSTPIETVLVRPAVLRDKPVAAPSPAPSPG